MNICKKEKLLWGKAWRGTHTWPCFRIDSYFLNPRSVFGFSSQCWRQARGEKHHMSLVRRVWGKVLWRWHQFWDKVEVLASYLWHMDAHSKVCIGTRTIHLLKGIKFSVLFFRLWITTLGLAFTLSPTKCHSI